MTTNDTPTYGQIDRSIRRLKDFTQEHTLLPETFAGQLERLVPIYTAVKPLLTMLALAPLLPPTWRKVIDLFNRTVEAIVADADGVAARFKAGRDL